MWLLSEVSLPGITLTIAAALVFALVIQLLVQSWTSGLGHVPGPPLARYTNLWAAIHALKLSSAKSGPAVAEFSRRLQREYGSTTVRTGPRTVTILDPAAIQVVYGVRQKLDRVRSSNYCLKSVGKDW
jgi:hypothetical protein